MKKYIAIAILSSLSSISIAADGDSPLDGLSNTSAYEQSSEGASSAPNGEDSSVPVMAATNTSPAEPAAMPAVNTAPEIVSTAIYDPMAPSVDTAAEDRTIVSPPVMPAQAVPMDNPVDRLMMPTTTSSYDMQDASYGSPRGHWEFGFAAGGAAGPTPVNETSLSRGAPIQKYRFKLTGEGVSGGLTAGYYVRRGQMSYGMGIAGYLDTFQQWNRDHKDDIYSADIGTSATYFKRTYTLEFAPRIGRYIQDYHLYGKLGVICSAFQYKFKDAASHVDTKKNITAWGGVAGIGLQKPINVPVFDRVNLGLEYNFHLYENLTPVLTYIHTTNTSKLRPRYHNAYLTLSKSL